MHSYLENIISKIIIATLCGAHASHVAIVCEKFNLNGATATMFQLQKFPVLQYL